MGPLKPKTKCCGELVCEDGGPPCIEWNRWTKIVQCRRCGAEYGLLEKKDALTPGMRPAQVPPPLRIRELKPGLETWVDVRGCLIHQESGRIWVDPKFSTTHEPSRDDAYPGLCSVLVRMNQKGELIAVEGDKNNMTIVPKDQSTSKAVLPLLWQVG